MSTHMMHMYTYNPVHVPLEYCYLYMCIYTCIVCSQQGVYGVRWLRLVGSIKLQVSFAEYHLFYRALLQMRPKKSSILLSEATP